MNVEKKFGRKVYDCELSDALRAKWDVAIAEGIPFFLDDFKRSDNLVDDEPPVYLINIHVKGSSSSTLSRSATTPHFNVNNTLVAMALRQSPDGRLTEDGINEYFMERYPFLKTQRQSWQKHFHWFCKFECRARDRFQFRYIYNGDFWLLDAVSKDERDKIFIGAAAAPPFGCTAECFKRTMNIFEKGVNNNLQLRVPARPHSIADMQFARFWFRQLMDCYIGGVVKIGYPCWFNIEMLRLLFDDEFPIQFRFKNVKLCSVRIQDLAFIRDHVFVFGHLSLNEKEGKLDFDIIMDILMGAGRRIVEVNLSQRSEPQLGNRFFLKAEASKNCSDIVPYINIWGYDMVEEAGRFLETKAKVMKEILEYCVRYEFVNKYDPEVHFKVEKTKYWMLIVRSNM